MEDFQVVICGIRIQSADGITLVIAIRVTACREYDAQ
jgi:hypothetical protein